MDPWAVSGREHVVIETSIGAIVGHSLKRAVYLLPATSAVESRHHFDGYDEVSMGIELTSHSDESFICRWRMQSFEEGLAFGEASQADTRELRRLDVTDAAEWQQLLHRRIVGVATAWHVPSDEASEAVWAVRLAFEGSRAVVLALGEADRDSSRLHYMPDSIVVIFDESVARAYEPPASIGSSWGSLVRSISG